MTYIFLANLLGLPALTVPVGLGRDSALPVGLHLLGGAWQEATLLRLARALEEAGAARAVRPAHFHHELDALLAP